MGRSRAALRSAGVQVMNRLADRFGYDVLERTYYSPIPDLGKLPAGFWDDARPMPGVDLRMEAALALLEGPLAPHIREFDPPRDPTPGRVFHLANRTYESVDAEVLFALIRHLAPKRVIELGSGASTAVMVEAVEGTSTELQVFDPYPRPHWADGLRKHVTIEERSAEDLPPSFFDDLGDGDVLFIDTSHTVRAGGDVTHLLLEVVPRLRPGVVVHVHDIFLPYSYPEGWFRDDRRYFAEQYLLQALLADSAKFEVLFPAHALSREHPDRLAAVIPSFVPGAGGAFWFRARAAATNGSS